MRRKFCVVIPGTGSEGIKWFVMSGPITTEGQLDFKNSNSTYFDTEKDAEKFQDEKLEGHSS